MSTAGRDLSVTYRKGDSVETKFACGAQVETIARNYANTFVARIFEKAREDAAKNAICARKAYDRIWVPDMWPLQRDKTDAREA